MAFVVGMIVGTALGFVLCAVLTANGEDENDVHSGRS